MTRSPQEVFTTHLDALSRRDIPALITDYAADALVLTQQGAMHGTQGAEQLYRQAFELLPDVEFTVTWTVFAGDTLLAGWAATANAGHVNNGVDTMSFTGGLISLHTTYFSIEANGTAAGLG